MWYWSGYLWNVSVQGGGENKDERSGEGEGLRLCESGDADRIVGLR